MFFASLSLAVTQYNTCNREFQELFNATRDTGTNLQAPSFILSQHSLWFPASKSFLSHFLCLKPNTKKPCDRSETVTVWKGWTEECGFTAGTGSHCWFRGRGDFYFMYTSILPTCSIVFHMDAQCPVPREARKELQIPWNWSYRWSCEVQCGAGNQAQVL